MLILIMCVSKPQKVLGFADGLATVEFMGEKRQVKSPFGLKEGDWVICQASVVVRARNTWNVAVPTIAINLLVTALFVAR